MQVYRGMDVGTAKPSRASRERIQHHMIDVADPETDFSVAEFQRQGRMILESISASGDRVLVVGGSGLHYRSVLDPMTFAPTDPSIRSELEKMTLDELQRELLSIDSNASDVVDMQNQRRVVRAIEVWRITAVTPSERAASSEAVAVREYRALVEHVSFGCDAGEATTARIRTRFEAMLADGLVAEVEGLAPILGRAASQAVGYSQVLTAIRGETSLPEAAENAIAATNRLVKRQRTYFRRDPRIEWMPWQDSESARIELAIDRIGEATGWTL